MCHILGWESWTPGACLRNWQNILHSLWFPSYCFWQGTYWELVRCENVYSGPNWLAKALDCLCVCCLAFLLPWRPDLGQMCIVKGKILSSTCNLNWRKTIFCKKWRKKEIQRTSKEEVKLKRCFSERKPKHCLRVWNIPLAVWNSLCCVGWVLLGQIGRASCRERV